MDASKTLPPMGLGLRAKDSQELPPSDMGQAIVRVVFVTAVVVWSYLAASSTLENAWHFGFFRLSLGYSIFSIVYAGWSYYLVSQNDVSRFHFDLKRIVGVLADLTALSAYTAITSENGIVLFPIFLTTIIGYGYRFGLAYLYLAISVGLVTFSAALAANPYLQSNLTLVGTYYLGLILVPLYASSLLKKHQTVLQRLREVNEARSRFIANMSHELRTPLHAIISLADVLREEADSREMESGSFSKIGMITDSAQHLLALVNRILDIASADAKAFKVTINEPLDLYDVIRRVVSICKPGALQKNLQFLLYVDPEVPSQCSGSEQHLQEVLVNTLGNAVKYTERGSVQLRITRDDKHSAGAQSSIKFEISDTGVGISAHLMPRIFEPFTLGDDSASRKHSGTGLGLTITKQYVEQMGGTVKLSPREGQGTVCAITLPFGELHSSEVGISEQRLNCLLVSSSYLTERDIAFFENAKCEIHQTNLQKFFSVSALAKYDLILVDESLRAQFIESAGPQISELSSTLFVEYFTKDAGLSPNLAPFISRVRAGAIGDLASIRHLHHALVNREVEAPSPEGPSLRLLIADDNPVNLKTAELALASAGHVIQLARDGDEALELLENGNFDLAILDMHMPGMSGLDVARFYNFMNQDDSTPIVLLTADATADTKREAGGARIREFLTKPMRARDLRMAVVKYARKTEPTEPQAKIINETVVHIDEAVVRSTEIEELVDLGTPVGDMNSIADEFYVDAVSLVRAAAKAGAEKRGIVVKEAMHSLKGAAATLGAGVLQKRAKRIEQSAIGDACRIIEEEALELEMLLGRTKQAMHRIIAEAYRRKRIGA